MNRTIKAVSLLTVTGLVGLASLKFAPKSNASNLEISANHAGSYIHQDFHGAEQEYSIATYYSEEYGTLYSYSPNARINVRSGPGTNYRVRHYGLSGDTVDILATSTYPDYDGYYWYNVRFLGSNAEGWIRQDLVR